jgi:hypothetical protein
LLAAPTTSCSVVNRWLTVDDGEDRNRTWRVELLLQHDRAQEVREAVAAVEAMFEDRFDVLPQRLPLSVGVPYV